NTPWTFFMGGATGLLLGFVVHSYLRPHASMWHDISMAILRCTIWFAAFALLERLPWSDANCLRAAVGGLISALLCWLFAGGVSFPSVAQAFWVMAALALTALPANQHDFKELPLLSRIILIPVGSAATLAFAISVFYPQLASSLLLRSPLQAAREYADKV